MQIIKEMFYFHKNCLAQVNRYSKRFRRRKSFRSGVLEVFSYDRKYFGSEIFPKNNSILKLLVQIKTNFSTFSFKRLFITLTKRGIKYNGLKGLLKSDPKLYKNQIRVLTVVAFFEARSI